MEYKKLSKFSSDSLANELDLFTVPLTKTSVLEGEWIELSPLREPTDDSPIEFQIDGNTNHYLDLNNSLIHVQCQVKNENGDLLTNDADKVTIMPSTLLLHTLFSSLNIQLNGREIEHEGNYPYRAYIETLLNHNKEAKRTHLETALWMNDKAGVRDTTDFTERLKQILQERTKNLSGSKTVDMVGRLHSSLFHQLRYLISGLTINIKLQRTNPKFVLQKVTNEDTSNYKIEISSIKMLIRKVHIHPSIVTSHSTLLSQGKKVQYPINHVETHFFTISPGRQNETINILQSKQEAKRLLIAMIDHTAKNGSYLHNPFNFQHFNLASVNLSVNGHNIFSKALQLSFGQEKLYSRAYFNLLSVCGKSLQNDGNGITLNEFENGYCIIAFDNTPDQCHGEGVHLIKHSTTSLELTFAKPLERTVSVMVYAEFDDLIEIDKTRIATRASKT